MSERPAQKTEIEITPAMIAAGVRVYEDCVHWVTDSDLSWQSRDDPAEIVKEIYEAMERTKTGVD